MDWRTIGSGLAGLTLALLSPEGALASPAQSADASAPAAPLAEFRRLRAEATTAARADDLVAASARLAEADALIPNNPGVILSRARLAAASGDAGLAVAQLGRYADAGLVVTLAGNAAFAPIADQVGFLAVSERIEANRQPVGADRFSALAEIPGTVLVESIVRDEARSRWLVSEVRGRTIVALDDAGQVTPFLNGSPYVFGIMGLAIDSGRGVLWAATAKPAPAADGPANAPGTSGLLKIDVATGRVLARYAPPGDETQRNLGDVAIGPDGSVYVADSMAGEIFRLPVSDVAGGLRVLVGPGVLGSPQGMVLTREGDALIVADYSSGLHRVDLSTGAATPLGTPTTASLFGIDGLVAGERAIYAIQNGVAPQRVLKLNPDETWSRIESAEVVAANLPLLDEPTTGLIRNGELVFVVRSQWSAFDQAGALTAADPAPATIGRLRLD